MKKVILCFAILLMVAVAAGAQTSFGIKGGMNISNLRGEDIAGGGETKRLIGANGGMYAVIPVRSNFFIQPEILYSIEGAINKSLNIKTRVYYVNVPILLKYLSLSGFYAELGPQVSLLTVARIKSSGRTFDYTDQISRINLSAGGGIGYNFTPALGVGVRYMLGLHKIGDNYPKKDIKTSNFSVGLNYTLAK